jgi:hypothetical protein
LKVKPALDVIKKLFSNSATAKQGFKVKPVIQRVTEVRRGPNRQVVEEQEYDHPTTGTWWAKVQAAVRFCVTVHVDIMYQYACSGAK